MSDIATKLTAIAENQQRVYNAGYGKGDGDGRTAGYNYGWNDGLQQGVVDGKQAEYDRFWDAYQQNGKKTDYDNCFGGTGWAEATFNPKYDIHHINGNSYMMFRKCGITNLEEAIKASGKSVTIDSYRLQYTFQYSQTLQVIGGIVFTVPLTHIDGAFQYCNKLKKIQTLQISENAIKLDFNNIPLLEDVSFTGTIPVNITFANSPNLTFDSVQSIIDHLKDLSGQTSQKVTFHSSVIMRMTPEQADAITTKNWTF